ncbi:MAG TPA: ABC transporter permease [Accumulibacter sp.]|uniref:ABC transporter permease n=1 Tax=Accumulibacter sp. TaxID=2053492 RepID=UPI002CC42E64|nr:FtsX-like permease family protein [Accumulibacter sp.]HMV04639.1 ABC transporter permease [Accumulibacter sp.]HMW64518.1 ABC transporter permease [Accumulibacter sp.]HMW81258.1 ABC transporter permease [Accumulibacter sp.]HNB68499.1 ABC transporter permease [Accumulibacter sp.]HNC27136.1 ABC transporter permease [Accumulibacter sp.]
MRIQLPGSWGFALRNVFRQRLRSAATVAAISLGVAGLILAGGFVQDIFVQLGEAMIHSQSGHLQIALQGYREGRTRAPEKYLIDEPEQVRREIMARPEKPMVLVRLGFAGMINNGKRDLGVIGEGVEPAGEAKLGSYLRYVEGRALADDDEDGIVLGQGVARTLGLKAGDRATLVISMAQGAVNTLDFEVIGIFQSFSKEFDAHAVRIPLLAAQKLMDTQSAHVLVVVLEQTEDTVRMQSTLRRELQPRGYDVIAWRELSDFYDKTVQLYDRQFGVLRFIILLMVLLSVANSVNMTIFERTKEFGTLLALGNRPQEVFSLIMSESVLLGSIGALLGVILGCLAATLLSAIGIPMPPPPNANIGYTALVRLVPLDVLTAAVIGFLATCLAAVAPARRASRLPIVDALRQGN